MHHSTGSHSGDNSALSSILVGKTKRHLPVSKHLKAPFLFCAFSLGFVNPILIRIHHMDATSSFSITLFWKRRRFVWKGDAAEEEEEEEEEEEGIVVAF